MITELNALTQSLEDTKQETLSFFDLSETELTKQYGKNKWNIRQLLHHLADAETVLYDRIKRVIADENNVIWAFDQDAWNEHLDYNTLPLSVNKAIFESIREAILHLAKQHYKSAENKNFVHSETGLRTLKDEFDKVALHNRHHLNQIKIALK